LRIQMLPECDCWSGPEAKPLWSTSLGPPGPPHRELVLGRGRFPPRSATQWPWRNQMLDQLFSSTSLRSCICER
jgi:hypothetical protein